MLQVVCNCAANYDYTGAATVASIFLGVFVALILGDAVLTAIALYKTLSRAVDPPSLPARKAMVELPPVAPAPVAPVGPGMGTTTGTRVRVGSSLDFVVPSGRSVVR